MVFKLQDTAGYNPLRIAAYERATGVAESAADLNLRTFPDTFRGYNSRLASLLGLDYLVLDRSIGDLPRQVPRPRATLLFAGTRFYVYHLDTPAAPRVYLATHVVPVDSDVQIEGGTVPDFTVGRDALVDAEDVGRLRSPALVARTPATEQGTGAADDGSATGVAASTATITAYGDNQVSVAVEAARDGVLVLHDVAYPGWSVSVDGHEAPLLRVNLLFRGVEVGAGRHTVTFAFHPLAPGNLAAAALGPPAQGRSLMGRTFVERVTLAGLALVLAGSGALAQVQSGGRAAAPPPSPNPPARSTPDARKGQLSLSAMMTPRDAQPIAKAPIRWRVFAEQADAQGHHAEVATSSEATPTLALPPGHLHRSRRPRPRQRRAPGDRDHPGLERTAHPQRRGAARRRAARRQADQPGQAVHLDLRARGRQLGGQARPSPGPRAGDLIGLPEGTYHVVSTLLDTAGYAGAQKSRRRQQDQLRGDG